MRIFHVLFTRQHGGLEQAYLDYTQALRMRGHEVVAVMTPQAPYLPAVAAHANATETCDAYGFYDFRAVLCLRRLLKKHKPDLIIAHMARAVTLCHMARLGLQITVMGVSHSYKIHRMRGADYLLVLTDHMLRYFVEHGYPPTRCKVMLNMIHLRSQRALPEAWPRAPLPVVGCIARLVEDKGVADLLKAAALAKQKGIPFKVRVAGTGPEEEALKTLAAKLGIAETTEILGWIEDKDAFFAGLDALCVPSWAEPFGLVVLEAWNYGVPLVASNTVGPSSLVNYGENGFLYEPADPAALAEELQRLFAGGLSLARQLVEGGYASVANYGMEQGAERLDRMVRFALS